MKDFYLEEKKKNASSKLTLSYVVAKRINTLVLRHNNHEELEENFFGRALDGAEDLVELRIDAFDFPAQEDLVAVQSPVTGESALSVEPIHGGEVGGDAKESPVLLPSIPESQIHVSNTRPGIQVEKEKDEEAADLPVEEKTPEQTVE